MSALEWRKPANQSAQNGSPPRPLTTFPLPSHILRGFNLAPREEEKYSVTNTGIWLPSSPKGVLQRMGWQWEEKSYKNLEFAGLLEHPGDFLYFPVKEGEPGLRRRRCCGHIKGTRCPPFGFWILGSGVSSKRLKWMEENFKVGQLFLSFPTLALYSIFCLLV